jgi:hypothetical protein
MKPPLPRILSVVPRTTHVRLEIAKAIRALAGPDEDELLRQRHAEIAAIRRDLEVLKRELLRAGREWLTLAKAELRTALVKYSPAQPRVPKGNHGGGQWTSGSKEGSEAPTARAHYADSNTRTRTDAAATGAGSADNASSAPRSWRKISASSISADDPKHPVPFLDSDGRPVLDARKQPLLRPADLSPEMYVREGLAYDFKAKLAAAEQGGMDQVATAWMDLAIQLSNFKHGGPWDAERISSEQAYVGEYHDPANMFIGLYMAATGVPQNDGLLIADTYARLFSSFEEPKDATYTHLSQQDVADVKMGYDLYWSGRIRPQR